MFKVFVLLISSLIVALVVLLAMEAFHGRQCSGLPPAGTTIAIPGESMKIVSNPGDQRLILDVVRDPFDIEDYVMLPEHGHIHPNQAEGFEVLEGRAKVLVGDEVHTLEPGDKVVVPPNTIHHWMALDEKPVRVEAYFEPPMEVASWFVEFQQHIADDTMNLMQAAVISREYGPSSPAPVEPSPWVWNAVSRVLAPVGRLMGYKACRASSA